MKNKILALAAVAEAGTGLLLLAYPPIVVRLLFGAAISGIATVLGRFGGICLLGLGVACWPRSSAVQQLYGMLTYNTVAMLYLIYIGLLGETVGVLLWPAVVAHSVLLSLLVRALFKERKTPTI
jgi:hypothetical protein